MSRLFLNLSIEAAYKVVDGIKMFDTRGISPNRAYFGLFQIGRDAWSDARRVYPKLNLPPFNEGKFDAKWNTLACVAYMMFNARQMITNTVYNKIKYGAVPVNGDTLYLAHNQGVAGSKRAIREGRFRNDQSDKAVQVLRDVRAQGVRA